MTLVIGSVYHKGQSNSLHLFVI